MPFLMVRNDITKVQADANCQESDLLYHTYISALTLADEHHLESIAFPLLTAVWMT